MKVLHVIPSVSPKYGGPSQALTAMCRALMARGVEVQIASTDAEPFGHLGVALESLTSYQRVPAIFFRRQLSEAFKYSGSMTRWLNRNVARFDLVHIHGVFSHSCIAAARACRRQRIPYLLRPLGNLDPWSLRQKSLRKKLFLNLGGRRMLRHAAAIQYTSQSEKTLSECALNLNHGVVIPLGVDIKTNGFAAANKSASANQSGPYVLFLSRLQPTKGVEALIDAFVAVKREIRFREWKLVIAGDGPADYVDSLRRKISAYDARDFILLPGWLEGDAKAKALREAALLALPSEHENFGLSVVEAMACGLPVLVSPQVALAPEIEAAGAGWIREAEPEALRITLSEILGDEPERQRRAEASGLLAARFDWRNVAQALAGLYESVLRRAAGQ